MFLIILCSILAIVVGEWLFLAFFTKANIDPGPVGIFLLLGILVVGVGAGYLGAWGGSYLVR